MRVLLAVATWRFLQVWDSHTVCCTCEGVFACVSAAAAGLMGEGGGAWYISDFKVYLGLLKVCVGFLCASYPR